MEGVIRHENADVAAMQFRRWFDQTAHLTETRDGMRKPVRWMAALWSIDGFGTIKLQRTCWDFPMGVARREAVDLLMKDLAKDDVGGMLPSDPLPLADDLVKEPRVQATMDDIVDDAMRGESIPEFPARPEPKIGGDCIGFVPEIEKVEEEEEEEELDEEEDDWEEVDDEDLDDDDEDDEDDDEDEEEDWD